MSKIKKIILIIIDLIKKSFFLSNLKTIELKGHISSLTFLRLLPYTSIKVPYSLGRTVRGISYNKNLRLDPAGKLCMDLSNGVSKKNIIKDLSTEFEKQKNMSAADIVHLKNNAILNQYPAWAIVMPWENLSIEEMHNLYPENFYKNRCDQGLIFTNKSRTNIIKTMYSSEFVENRVNQMQTLLRSVVQKGFIQDSNLPKINILIKENQWRWFMGDGGNHRSYVLSCLGHNFFRARISSIINKSEVNNWHNVINGTYSVNDAEHIFDRYFDGSKTYRGMV